MIYTSPLIRAKKTALAIAQYHSQTPVREEPEERAPESGPPAREETEGFPPPPEDVGDPFTE